MASGAIAMLSRSSISGRTSFIQKRDYMSRPEPSGVLGYSSLINSGLRAITARARKSPTVLIHVPRSSSTQIPSTTKRDRRSSVSSLSSLFSKRKPSPHGEKIPPHSDIDARPSTSSLKSESIIKADVWISDGAPVSVLDLSSDSHYDSASSPDVIDTSYSSPSAKSLSLNPTPKRGKNDSFLSFSTSSRESVSHPSPRRERPTSVQTMPIPSHRLSWQVLSESQESLDMIGELSRSILPQMAEESEQETMRLGDWRQFHADWLQNESPAAV